MVLPCLGQFVPQPLNYPAPGYWPYYISITDSSHVWIGTINESYLPYSWCAKTTDGGATWSGLTSTQFEGGFANFYHAFSADTGVAMGDPTEGYFEIQLTYDGGATWTRLPLENIPPPLTNEIGFNNMFSAVGNCIWFATSMGRCYRSADRGQHWDVTQVTNVSGGMFDVCFSSGLKGAFYSQNVVASDIAVTYDGGITWDTVTFPQEYYFMGMSSVGGFDGGFVITGWQSLTDVFFTPDMFTNIVQIESDVISNGAVSFLDASTGWLAGGESGTNEIYKYTGALTSVNTLIKPSGKLSIIPNPTANEALFKVPGNVWKEPLTLKITDMSGRIIDEYTIKPSEWIKTDASAYRNGLYLVELLSGNGLVTCEKWIIKH